MEEKKKKFLLETTSQINRYSMLSALGFFLYLAAMAMKLQTVAGIISIVFAVAAVRASASAINLRDKDKEAVGYNLLWGTTSMAVMLIAFAVLSIKVWLGL